MVTYEFQHKGKFVTVTVWRISLMKSCGIASTTTLNSFTYIYEDKGISGAKVDEDGLTVERIRRANAMGLTSDDKRDNFLGRIS